MKSKYLKSILLIFIIVLGFAGATYAWFTDTATNSGNRIQAGNLSVAFEASDSLDGVYRDISDTSDPVFDFGDAAGPGDGPFTSYIKITNAGNLSMDYRISFIVIEDGLAELVSFEIEKVVFNGETNDYTKITVDGNDLANEYLEGEALGEADYEIYKITMSFDADNTYNLDADDANFPLAYEFDITVNAWQEAAPDPS